MTYHTKMVTLSYPSKVRAGIAVIIEVPDISQPMLTGIFFKIFLLVLDVWMEFDRVDYILDVTVI